MKLQSLKWPVLSLFFLAFLYVVISVLFDVGFGFSYQDSTSMPEGWYLTLPVSQISPNEILLFRPPSSAEKIMLKHQWILPGAVMMKEAMGMPGDFVCIQGKSIMINERPIAKIISDYAPNHPLPHLSLCRSLSHNEYMMMSTHIPNSFDSRYFGPIKRSAIIARAIKL